MLRRRDMSVRVRFAPSPSGYLHIGGARTALFNWLWARKCGGSFILRVEDSDQERSSPESVRAVLDALRWLGLDWDEGPEVGGPEASYFQSDRRALYHAACEQLIESGAAYRCTCTKEELEAARQKALAENPKQPFKYPGTCRDQKRDASLPHVVRFRAPDTGSTDFDDLVFGPISTPNSALYDFVLLRQDGYPIYNLGCVVDDHAMGVTLVARGRDHLGNTPHQVLLYRAFGWQLPEFAHLPLMMSPKGEKLSKRHGSVAVQDYQARGYTPNGVLNYLVRFGWSFGDQEIFSREQLVEAFDWRSVGRADGKFDEKKFADVAFEHLKTESLLSSDEYARRVMPFLAARGLAVSETAALLPAIATIRPRARNLVEAADALDFYFRDPPAFDEKAAAKFLTPGAVRPLEAMANLVRDASEFTATSLEPSFQALCERTGLNAKDVAQPVRVALTGRSASPGLFDVMAVLGKQRALERLHAGIERARSAD
jgi:glutamyl-tRNA synthetase